jgi:hypothetical protein
MTQSNFIDEVKDNVRLINHTVTDETLLDFVVKEVVDRVLIYLNVKPEAEVEGRLVRIVARIASGVFNQTSANVGNAGADSAISSVSDNGQSVHYANEVKNYLATGKDNELFGGFAELLKPYRRVNVVS